MPDDVSSLADEKFVSLATFKKSGEKVAGAMWLARDGDALVMWTPADSWKVKRLRRDSRVELTPCGRTGTVPDGRERPPRLGGGRRRSGGDLPGRAADQGQVRLEFYVITFVERIVARGKKIASRSGSPSYLTDVSPRSARVPEHGVRRRQWRAILVGARLYT